MNRISSIGLTLFALGLASTACGGAIEDPAELETPRSQLPSALAGEWFTGSLTSLQYYDTANHKWIDRGGSGFYYIFGGDGSYESGAVIDSTVSGCTIRLLGKEIGTMTLDADLMTAHRAWVRTHATNSCGQSGENELGPETTTMRFLLEEAEFGEALVIELDGGTSRYHRWKQ